jgi:hypothetical protein
MGKREPHLEYARFAKGGLYVLGKKDKKLKPANLVLEAHLRELGFEFKSEFLLCPGRKWRADYFIDWRQTDSPERAGSDILIEIEGAVWTNGRHTRGSGYTKDLEKYRMAAALGYKVFRFSTGEVLDGTAKEFLRKWA